MDNCCCKTFEQTSKERLVMMMFFADNFHFVNQTIPKIGLCDKRAQIVIAGAGQIERFRVARGAGHCAIDVERPGRYGPS